MFRSSLLPCLFFVFPLFLAAQPKIQLVDWADGFTRPVDIAHCGDSRMFVVEQAGIIWTLDSLGNKLDTFLNIDPRVNSTGNEQGLLGLAFHPDYAQNGYFFVYYTKNSSGATQVSRFSVKPGNPNEADPDSELSIFSTPQPFANHNGGCLKFGPDGYLYIGLGDGGSGGDPQGNGQKKNTFLGKILRIDVNNSSMATPYVVPPDNPFVGQADYYPEIWALGLRNPWRYSFDRLTGDMWIGDVGQVTREEVDFQPAGVGGRNYGWRCYEGTFPYATSGCNPQNTYTGPVFDYDNSSVGCSMTGGFIYRGSKYADLYGVYLNADYCSGRIWGTTRPTDSTFTTTELADLGTNEFSSFGEDRDGELYIALLANGKVQKITELCSPFQVSGTASEAVCDSSFSGTIFLDIANAQPPVNFLWSNGSTDKDIVYLNPGTYIVNVTDGNNCVRRDTFIIANATLPAPTVSPAELIICAGLQATLTASTAPVDYLYQWYVNGVAMPPTDNNFLTVTADGQTAIQVRFLGPPCPSLLSAPSIVNATTDIPVAILQYSNGILSAEGSNVDGTIQWFFENTLIADSTGYQLHAEQSGTYSILITNSYGCTSTATIEVVISDTPTPPSVQVFSLAPNPTDGTMLLKMELTKMERFSIALSDTHQRQIFMQTHQSDKITLPIDLRALPAGTYFLKVQTESGSFVRKVVKR